MSLCFELFDSVKRLGVEGLMTTDLTDPIALVDLTDAPLSAADLPGMNVDSMPLFPTTEPVATQVDPDGSREFVGAFF